MFNGIKTLDDFNFKSKRVLLRIDINGAVSKGKLEMSDRIKEHSKTIIELKRKKAKIVILAHQSRPGKDDFIKLKQHAKLLSKFTKVKYVDDIIGKKAIKEIKNLKDGGALLLDNVRLLKEEFEPGKNKLVTTLVPLFDIYLNDAFSVSHRAQTSVVSFPKYLDSGIGRVMEEELRGLSKIKLKDCLFILCGAKAEEHMLLLEKIPKSSNILSAGLFGQLILIGKGKDLGFQNKLLKDELKNLKILKKYLNRIETPKDFAIKKNNKRVELSLDKFPVNYEIFDIGSKTIKEYIYKIKNSKCVFMKGTAGYCEDKQFCKGTRELLNTIAGSKAYSILGGGHLTTAMKKLNVNKNKFGFVSLSGGALVEYIAGKKLPGIEVLKNV